MKKLIALFLLITTTLVLFGCDDDLNGNSFPWWEKEDNHLGAFYIVEDYETFTHAISLAEENDSLVTSKKQYSFSESIGEEYKVIYSFTSHVDWCYYPITIEKYFQKVKSAWWSTYMLYTGNGYCENEYHDAHDESLFGMEFGDYQKYPFIIIDTLCEQNEIIEINDEVSVRVEQKFITQEFTRDDYYRYYIYNGETALFSFKSCIELNEETINALIDKVIIVDVK